MADKSFSLRAVISAVDKITGPLASMNKAIAHHRKAWADVGNAAGNVGKSVTAAVTGPLAKLGATIGIAGGGFGIAKVVEASAQFEKFTAILETVDGSAQKAKEGMAWVSDFAAKTPYELSGVTDAFVRLKAYGIDPQKGALKSAGDAAAAMGKPLEQAVEALADAMTGENERLKEFGITTRQVGNSIVYQWVEDGKMLSSVVDKNEKNVKAHIQAVVTGIWNRRYQGAMDKLSQTWTGMWSNLQDAVTRFLVSIGDAGFFDAIKHELQGVLDLFNQWNDDGTLKEIATQISGILTSAISGLKDRLASIDWKAIVGDLRAFWGQVQAAATAVGGWGNALLGLAVIMNAGTIVAMAQLAGAVARLGVVFVTGAAAAVRFALGLIFADQIQAFTLAMQSGLPIIAAFNIALSANPIGLAIIAITALIAAGWALVANWDAVKAWASDLWASISSIWKGGVDFIAALVNGDVAGAITGILALGKGVVSGLKVVFAPIIGLVDKVAQLAGLKLPNTPEVQAVQQVATHVGGLVSPAPAPPAANQNVPATASAGGGVSPALAASITKIEVVGNLVVKFEDSPPGMRVDGGGTNYPGLGFSPDVGYRNTALGRL